MFKFSLVRISECDIHNPTFRQYLLPFELKITACPKLLVYVDTETSIQSPEM